LYACIERETERSRSEREYREDREREDREERGGQPER
jgi:hypothetical protein